MNAVTGERSHLKKLNLRLGEGRDGSQNVNASFTFDMIPKNMQIDMECDLNRSIKDSDHFWGTKMLDDTGICQVFKYGLIIIRLSYHKKN